MSSGLVSNLVFRVFRMLLILTGVVGAMAITFPLIQTLTTPGQPPRARPSAPSAR
ncbi:MAG: hypothetical protein NTV57_17320 [Cyanobacteria bacterium]|nr:hypothetical protein [Cyanobacteriota bacterium]